MRVAHYENVEGGCAPRKAATAAAKAAGDPRTDLIDKGHLDSGPVYASFGAMLGACRQGLGFSLVRTNLVAEDLRRGTLARAFDEVLPSGLHLHLVTPEGLAQSGQTFHLELRSDLMRMTMGAMKVFAWTFLIAMAIVGNARAEGGAVILAWNDQALNAVRGERLGTPVAARLYAMVNVAMYDAVNGINRARFGRFGGREFALVEPAGAPRRGNRRAAATAAAHQVLVALVPGRTLEFDSQLAADLASLDNGVSAGQMWGEYVGREVVARREDDGSSPQDILPGGAAAGQFRSNFTSAQFRNLTPFGIESALPYVSGGAPALDSLAYAGALAEVQLLGNGNNPDTEFDEIFSFWRGGGGSAWSPGEWIKIALTVFQQEGTTRSLSRSARLFALMGMAMADAVLPAWNNKFNFQFWRPGTAIPQASTDGNPLTVADSVWGPRNGGLGSSPEHTSGQSTFAGAGSTVLSGFYCTDFIPFIVRGDDAIAGPRAFSSFSEAAREAGRARILAGIHFEFSNQAGQDSGRLLANEILTTRLQPFHPHHDREPRCPQS